MQQWQTLEKTGLHTKRETKQTLYKCELPKENKFKQAQPMLIVLPKEKAKCRTWDVYRKYICLSRSLYNCLAIIVLKEKNYKISCIMYFWCLNGFYTVVFPVAFGKKYLVLCLSKGYRLLIYIVPRKSPGFNQYDYFICFMVMVALAQR